MNVMFKISGTVVTPELTGSVLPGITRKSCLELIRSWGIPVEERTVSVDEVVRTAESGEMEECFGTGTAAVVSPVKKLDYEDRSAFINNGEIGPFDPKAV